jgi:hypothetical protein
MILEYYLNRDCFREIEVISKYLFEAVGREQIKSLMAGCGMKKG